MPDPPSVGGGAGKPDYITSNNIMALCPSWWCNSHTQHTGMVYNYSYYIYLIYLHIFMYPIFRLGFYPNGSPYVTVRSTSKYSAVSARMQWCAYYYTPGPYRAKMDAVRDRSWIFPVEHRKWNMERKAAVQTCPPSMIYAAKLGIQVTTTVVQLCAAVSGHTSRGWLMRAGIVDIGCCIWVGAHFKGLAEARQ